MGVCGAREREKRGKITSSQGRDGKKSIKRNIITPTTARVVSAMLVVSKLLQPTVHGVRALEENMEESSGEAVFLRLLLSFY